MNEIIELYNSLQSIKAVSRETGISEQKIKRILISEGLYSCEIGDEIQKLYEQGISIDEICKKVKRGRSCVISYLPYSKGEYGREDVTENAKKIREWREKRKNNL